MWLASPLELQTFVPSQAAAYRLRCTAEHLIARSHGGKNTSANIVAACYHCNHTRHTRKQPPEPERYRDEIGQRMARLSWHPLWVHAAASAAP